MYWLVPLLWKLLALNHRIVRNQQHFGFVSPQGLLVRQGRVLAVLLYSPFRRNYMKTNGQSAHKGKVSALKFR